MTNAFLLSCTMVALTTLVSAADTWTVYNVNHVPVKKGSEVAGANVMTPVQQLTNALAQAAGGSTIVIKPGTYDLAAELTAANTYDSTGLSYLTIEKKQLFIKGEDTTHWSQKTAEQETVLKGGTGGRIIYGYAGNGRSSVFQHLTFEGGTASTGMDGGAIVFLGTENCQPFVSGYASNCVFRSNSAGMSGGATAYVSVYDSFFTNNVAGQGGAAYGTSQFGDPKKYTNDFISCVFVDNVMTNASSGGGALYCAIPGRLEGCTFVGNRTVNNGAKGLGGAIYSKSDIPRIFKCTFTNNVAANGGAIYTDFSLNELAESTFVGNRTANNGAAGYGGAIYSKTDIPRIFKCAFTNNVAANGGAIYIKTKVNELAESTFVGNHAGKYATLMAEGGYGTITGCTFKDNVAQDSYAGVAAPSMALAGTVENCIFDNNTNKDANVGSQICFAQQVTGCTFRGAGDMFALYYDRCLFDGCLFDYDKYGGGMIVYDSTTGVGHLRNCLFQNNTMHVAINNATGEMLEIANCTFVSNRVIRSVNRDVKDKLTMSDGYLFYAFRGTPDGSSSNLPSTNRVVNCAFYNNYRHESSSSDEMVRNDVTFYATSTGVASPAGNILDHGYYQTAIFVYTPIQSGNVSGVAPKFVAGDARYPDAPYYMPRRSSPLRNAGQYLDWMESAVDLAGNARVIGGKPDIGCYECNLKPYGMVMFLK